MTLIQFVKIDCFLLLRMIFNLSVLVVRSSLVICLRPINALKMRLSLSISAIVFIRTYRLARFSCIANMTFAHALSTDLCIRSLKRLSSCSEMILF